jgi:peptidoglycan hydrolase CwlO-like protein
VRFPPGAAARASVFVLTVVLACACAIPVAVAAPTTPQIKAKQAEAVAAQRALDRLGDDFEMKVEEYNAVTEALEQTRGDIERTRIELEAASVKLTTAQDRLAERARAIYTSGSVDLLAVLIGTSSFDDFLTRLDMLNRISGSDADLVEETSGYRDRVASSESSLINREAEQIALRQEAEAKRLQVEDSLKKQQSYVAGLNSEVTRLMKEEQERQRKIAEEMARRAAAEPPRARPAARRGRGTLRRSISRLGTWACPMCGEARRHPGSTARGSRTTSTWGSASTCRGPAVNSTESVRSSPRTSWMSSRRGTSSSSATMVTRVAYTTSVCMSVAATSCMRPGQATA